MDNHNLRMRYSRHYRAHLWMHFDPNLMLGTWRTRIFPLLSIVGKPRRVQEYNLALKRQVCCQVQFNEMSIKKHCGMKTIGTHDGTFHCDEVLACYMLKRLPEYSEANIVRSRNEEILKSCDIVVDVGGVYDPSKHRYDHHQRSFSGSMQTLTDGKRKWVTKLSSAGLIYLHFGHRILSTISDISMESPILEDLYEYVYTGFMEEIDAVDNGISDRDGEPRYCVNSTISKRVGNLNPAWNEIVTDKDRNERFQKAMELVGDEFTDVVSYFQRSWLPAKQIVEQVIANRHEVHSSGEVLKLESYCPWKSHLFSIEESVSISPSIKYVLYQEATSTKWRIQAVPVYQNSFENRLSLPESWRGLRGAELDAVAGIPGCVFVHNGGFIGGNESFEGALKMASAALNNQQTMTGN